jgi:hypothetical protein
LTAAYPTRSLASKALDAAVRDAGLCKVKNSNLALTAGAPPVAREEATERTREDFPDEDL